MSPKEKALQLVQRYINEACQDDEVVLYTSIAKKCALIAVDEILKLQLTDGYDHEFWQEVKQEIEKL